MYCLREKKGSSLRNTNSNFSEIIQIGIMEGRISAVLQAFLQLHFLKNTFLLNIAIRLQVTLNLQSIAYQLFEIKFGLKKDIYDLCSKYDCHTLSLNHAIRHFSSRKCELDMLNLFNDHVVCLMTKRFTQ